MLIGLSNVKQFYHEGKPVNVFDHINYQHMHNQVKTVHVNVLTYQFCHHESSHVTGLA